MGDYNDYSMISPDSGAAIAGVCHQRGTNSELPSQWLIYIRVADLDASMKACIDGGGKIIAGPKSMGPDARNCTIQDPAGDVCSLYWKRE